MQLEVGEVENARTVFRSGNNGLCDLERFLERGEEGRERLVGLSKPKQNEPLFTARFG